MKTTTLTIAAVMAAGTLAHAQDAVQWRVADGGTGDGIGIVTRPTTSRCCCVIDARLSGCRVFTPAVA